MLDILMDYPLMLPEDVAEFLLRTLDEMEAPDGSGDDDYGRLALMKDSFYPRFLIDLGRYEEAEARSLDAIARHGDSSAPFSNPLLISCYNNLAYIRMHRGLKTHIYDFASYARKAMDIFEKTPAPIAVSKPLSYACLRSLACYVGVGAERGGFEAFRREMGVMSGYLSKMLDGQCFGYDDLCEAEIAFYRCEKAEAKSSALTAIEKASALNQYETEARAIFYMIRIALMEGVFEPAENMFARLSEVAKTPTFVYGRTMYDFVSAYLFSLLNIRSLIPARFLLFPDSVIANTNITTAEYMTNIRCLISSEKYEDALSALGLYGSTGNSGRFLIGELTRALFCALAHYGLGNRDEALSHFEIAYSHSQNGEIIMPFIEFGRGARGLVKLARENDGCDIPRDWLERLDVQASAYAKKSALVAAGFRKKYGVGEGVRLSEREAQLLRDIYQGLSRQEIAATRYLSINTVKTELKNLYAKLEVSSAVEAVRVANELDIL
jgi:DNA-binding CsgD family transcriptional regulator